MALLNAVIDISHHNGGALDFAKAKADGILGVIHKASQGQSNTDPLSMPPENATPMGASRSCMESQPRSSVYSASM